MICFHYHILIYEWNLVGIYNMSVSHLLIIDKTKLKLGFEFDCLFGQTKLNLINIIILIAQTILCIK